MLDDADSGVSLLAAPGHAPVLDGGGAAAGLLRIERANDVTVQGIRFTRTAADGHAVALIGGGRHRIQDNGFDRTGTAIVLTGSSGNHVGWNLIRDSAASAIEAKDGAHGNTFESNTIDGTGAPDTHGGGFFLHGVSGNAIRRNLVRNTAGMGIGVVNWDDTTINVGNTIEWNVLRDTNLAAQDSGAIYMLGRSQVDTKALIAHNLVERSGADGSAHVIGIYLDDSTKGALVRDNIVRDARTHALQVHGGDDNTVVNNVFDLGPRAVSAVLFQAAPADTHPSNTMLGNSVVRNVMVAGAPGQTAYSHLDGGVPHIAGNQYTGLADLRAGPVRDDEAAIAPGPSADHAEAAAAANIGFMPIDRAGMGPKPPPRPSRP